MTAETVRLRQTILPFGVCLALVAVVAASGANFRPGPWYEALRKPSWTPPNGVFAPVWLTLYVMIAIAGGLAMAARNRPAVAFWLGQLVLNGLWSWIFFGQHKVGLALADIALMWLAIAAFIGATWNRQRSAALLFLPYLAWVSYASALNLAIWRLNG